MLEQKINQSVATEPNHTENEEFIQSQTIAEFFGSHVHDIRKKKGWSMETLAEKAGLSVDTIKRIEKNRAKHDRHGKSIKPYVTQLDAAVRIAIALDVPIDTLLPKNCDDDFMHVEQALAVLGEFFKKVKKT